MNGELPDCAPWSRQRWAGVVVLLFGLHLALFHRLSPRPEEVARPAESGLQVCGLSTPDLARRTLDILLLDDPTLLAMASPRGFSGAAWLRPQPQAYRTSEWTDAERPLAQPTQALGGAFGLVAAAGPQPDFRPGRKPATLSPSGVSVTPTVLRDASRLLVQGEAARRPLVQSPALRSWSHTDVLGDTRVRVLISDEGLVLSPRLVEATVARNPVQREADLYALGVARSLRFAPNPKVSTQGLGGAVVEGILIFQWHTVEPPAGAKE